jgi:hypothetical protein
MGAAIGDFDNDGDLDWFVSSIWSATGVSAGGWGITGNRLYRNRGDGTFDDVTETAGVRHGYWGWGSVFADLNNDGMLDIFHVNGFPSDTADEYHADPARLFVSNGDGTFTQRAEELGVADTGQGRGVTCFDYDGDGDLDLFLTNMDAPGRLYRNDLPAGTKFLAVRLTGNAPNTQAIGARIFVTANGVTQMRELRAASNFVSQDPAGAWFGLGAASTASLVRVVFPDGTEQRLENVAANQTVVVGEGRPPQVDVPTLGGVGLALLGVLIAASALFLIGRGRIV